MNQSTGLSEGKRKHMKIQKPKTAVITMATVILVAVVSMSCTFAGAAKGAQEPEPARVDTATSGDGTGGSGQGLSPRDSLVSYGLVHIKNGKAQGEISPLQNGDARLAEDTIMNYALKSTVWPGNDIKTLDKCYLLRATYSDGTTADYYAYLLDGKAVMQRGADGYYSRIDDTLFEKLAKLTEEGGTSTGG